MLQANAETPSQSIFHLDIPLLLGLMLLCAIGLTILYSAGGENMDLVLRQGAHMLVGFTAMLVLAQIPTRKMRRWVPWMYAGGMLLLLAVIVAGDTGKGAQRWLNLGVIRFQPSEIMKIIVPMTVAWYIAQRPLPPSAGRTVVAVILLLIPTALIIKQPDLGTALLIAGSGASVIVLAGLNWRVILGLSLAGVAGILAIIFTPLLTWLLHPYQVKRVRTLLNPEQDPLGAGYHIIQSKIAIGSGGVFGKGWFNGTQSHLEFLPERSTDFIFAVFSEEFGFLGVVLLLSIYLLVIARSLYIATQAQGMFARLLAGSITLTFFIYIFVNIGMVSGILPVVGLPLPLLSYGGTSLVTLLSGFGLVMGAYTHRRLLSG